MHQYLIINDADQTTWTKYADVNILLAEQFYHKSQGTCRRVISFILSAPSK